MIQITIYQDTEGRFHGFDSEGHAEYADPGFDIVCAGVSSLVITAVNSIETLTADSFNSETEQESGQIKFRMNTFGHDSQLLLQSLILGLEEMERNYSEYIDVIFKEV
ncbi:Predicted ribosomal protein [uncultured Roseburia sp.]|uniref:Ribosomal processing cysteine protease Prp n=1 Tax=Brotonthovivens ammoniilytica TaxID=2981725 RepID=A0ABT2TGE3_9FIRM|nr:ribosomal-processing cysteine protease Prp [Brotonthovivens ammoniilytica]MCU6761253.1 ribosomal-processing cysteine protease Prp [Brotonthovivens ammoniilytica]SCI23356.1 Predicted ribosomal protein [uncultured Roseburia sp.]